MARFHTPRGRPVRRATPVSRSIEAVRLRAHFSLLDMGRALGVHPRTVRRWEIGESRPRASQWARLLAFDPPQALDAVRQLAELSGEPVPAPTGASVDPALVDRVLSDAADALDLAPKRVRAVLRAVADAAARVGVRVDAVVEQTADLVASPDGR